ncbi:DsbA family protein [Psychrobium sp. 1_MG-2023]|uniref:DsbA family protein n=1 Tax=Psychrobium sp. 1_MG-2023 TaxID=3062624 RepID=UPI000C31FBF5|nr:DsbA family protein [Psychrobium sp. 1_MG-2023]MDP2561703.1 DsbA family protein [Psychrobium sp. 1_MG-2023]PKF57104.1 DsbA family protein [Alteromonadales bacterium alter-6D02]
MKRATLYYVYDPMCSWCWGYRPTWQLIESALNSELNIEYCVGGLAPDSQEPMPQEMQQGLQQIWHKIAQQLGTEFNFDFWELCQPRRSTYPACRAMLVAREAGLEQEMLKGVQQAYYLQAKNPSDNKVLSEVAMSIGMDQVSFNQQLNAESVNEQLMKELALSRQLPINGFPSLVLNVDGELTPIAIDYQQSINTVATIRDLIK